MTQIVSVDVLIIGSGPAGISTALHLVQADQSWADRIVVIEKAVHPRDKLCGGGVTRTGENILNRLGLSFDAPHVPVREMQIVYENEAYLIQGNPAFRVTRRGEFDHWLVQCAQKRGITLRQDEAVKDIRPAKDYVEVVTERATYHTQVVVAADGSRSFTRRKLKWNDRGHLARLLEVLTPENGAEQTAFRDGAAVVDFSYLGRGLQGYYWDFPSFIKGQPVMNRGLFDSRVRSERPRMALKQTLAESLAKRGRDLADCELKGYPIRWFSRKGQFSRPRIILAGDAAGVDPLLGEGIAFALAYGEVATTAIIDAFTRQDFSFAGYKELILAHSFLSVLPTRIKLARLLYLLKYPWQARLLWKITSLVLRAFIWFSPNPTLDKSPRLVKLRD